MLATGCRMRHIAATLPEVRRVWQFGSAGFLVFVCFPFFSNKIFLSSKKQKKKEKKKEKKKKIVWENIFLGHLSKYMGIRMHTTIVAGPKTQALLVSLR